MGLHIKTYNVLVLYPQNPHCVGLMHRGCVRFDNWGLIQVDFKLLFCHCNSFSDQFSGALVFFCTSLNVLMYFNLVLLSNFICKKIYIVVFEYLFCVFYVVLLTRVFF